MSPLNLAVLAGTLAKTAEVRLLPDGSNVWELDVAVSQEGRAAARVPVSWAAVPPGVDPAGWVPGDELVVVGAVRRRFYRAGGATVSRTDVLADAVVPARQTKRSAALLKDAMSCLSASQARSRRR